MRTRNNKIKIDRAKCAADNASKGEEKMRNSSKKTPWHLRFAPGAILRPIGRLAFKAVSLASAIIQPVRQRLNQWNWRQKTALVTALAITAAGNFVYQYKVNAAWPAVIAGALSMDFLVQTFTGYAINQGLNAAFDSSILKETAVANTDKWLYSKRKYYQRDYSYNGSTTTTDTRVDDQAEAAQNRTYTASGTDTALSPSTLDADEVLDYYVSHNTHLRRGYTDTHQILENGEPLYTWTRVNSRRYIKTISFSWGGYVQKPTDEEIQEELDYIRDQWNSSFQRSKAPGRRPARLLGPLTLGPKVGRTLKSFTCEKEVKLWSDFKHVDVPGSNDLSPTELEEPGSRSTYVTRLSYKAREAGYNSGIVTKVPQNERLRHDYPEPLSYDHDHFKRFALTKIPWRNFRIISGPTWVGRAKRYFKHKEISNWCLTCNHAHPHTIRRNLPNGVEPCSNYTTKHEYPVYQNENVVKPSA